MKKLFWILSAILLPFTFFSCNLPKETNSNTQNPNYETQPPNPNIPGIDKEIDTPFPVTPNPDNEKLNYDSLIDFPNRMEDNTCNHNVSYLVYYPSENNSAIYADVEIKKFTYTFDDNIEEKLTISFIFECYIIDIHEISQYFAFEIVAYDYNNTRIKTTHIYSEGEIDETVRVEASLTLDMYDVKNGISIKFCNYEA